MFEHVASQRVMPFVVCRYCTSIAEDNAVVNDPDAGPREKVAARLLRIEKTILNGELTHMPPCLVSLKLLWVSQLQHLSDT